MNALIEFQDIYKIYHMGDEEVRAVDGISFQIFEGEFVAIIGTSGSGKSTCMNIIGCLDVPTSGTYLLDGRDAGGMNTNELAAIRNELLGFIFQQYNLLVYKKKHINYNNMVVKPITNVGGYKNGKK